MKTINYFLSLCFILFSASFHGHAQSSEDSTGLPGDNFDLQGALQMFQNATSPEEFEKAINTEGNYVNNLDLDGDGDIDYVRVTEKTEKDLHVFVLQIPVSSTETQDIATIEIEKTGKESAVIQIIGDEDIYGEEIIVEPDGGGNDGAFIDHSYNSNLHGPHNNFDNTAPVIVVNVWLWPSVRYVYAPAYKPWISPWRWHAYPGWWKPWRPFAYHAWHPYRVRYHRPFVVVHTNRVMHAHSFYKPYRSTSVIVSNRHSGSVNNYRVTKSRTTVTGPKGKKTTVKKTTVTGPRGNKGSKIKVRRH